MIRIQNIYYMLSYAFQALNEQGYKNVATEDFENVADLCVSILIKGVASQIKRGLGKEYVPKNEAFTSLRGKIDITKSVKEMSMLDNRLICTYDDFSVNSYLNRILKATMKVLLKGNIRSDRRKQVRKLLPYFSDVQEINIHG